MSITLKRSLGGAIVATLLVASGLQPAAAAKIESEDAMQSVKEMVHSSGASGCTYATGLVIEFEGDDTAYSLDPSTEELVEGPTIEASGCTDTPDGLLAPMAAAPTPLGTKVFTSSARTYKKTDSNGVFEGQYAPGTKHAVAFRYTVATILQKVTTGPAKATVSRTPDKGTCSYNKTQAINYIWHWSCSTPFNKAEKLSGNWTFPINVNGRNGTATILWTFNYRVASASCSPGKPC